MQELQTPALGLEVNAASGGKSLRTLSCNLHLLGTLYTRSGSSWATFTSQTMLTATYSEQRACSLCLGDLVPIRCFISAWQDGRTRFCTKKVQLLGTCPHHGAGLVPVIPESRGPLHKFKAVRSVDHKLSKQEVKIFLPRSSASIAHWRLL